MNKKNIKRSPLFYVGDKYKLMSQIIGLFPKNINDYYEPFLGGGTVYLNVNAKKYYLNDIDNILITLHRFLNSYALKSNDFFNELENIIFQYNFSRSYKEDVVPDKLKKAYKKTYFARYNQACYFSLRKIYNESKNKSPLILYILLIYGFNRMLRFNNKGEFNIPVGNVDLNNNVIGALKEYFSTVEHRSVSYTCQDFRLFLKTKFQKEDFIYFDPPYLITFSEYNKLWNEKNETELLLLLDKLNNKGVKFALSNVTYYKGKSNDYLIKWMGKYNYFKIKSNYISYHNNGTKKIEEVLITNYEP